MSKEAMKLALEALELYLKMDTMDESYLLEVDLAPKAITALRKALAEQPAQRTWVGLTDVEWMNIVNKDQAWFGQRPDEVAHEVAKLVEAKLKEKNNG